MRHKHNYQLLVETRQKHPVTGKLWMVRVDVDVAGLVQMMAESAMNAKGGEARACYGDVRVRATQIPDPKKTADLRDPAFKKKFKIRIEYGVMAPETKGAVRAWSREQALTMVTPDPRYVPTKIFCKEINLNQACLFSDDWNSRLVRPEEVE